MDNNKQDHSGHRRRLRQKFTESMSLDGFDEASILELLLFYSIPRADTRGTAQALLDRFGSLKDVLEAPFDELNACPGVGGASSMLLKLIPAFAKAYYGSESTRSIYLTDAESIGRYLYPKFRMQRDEICILLALENNGRLLREDVISHGGRDFAEIDIGDMIDRLKTSGATAAIISHNHPAGLCVPSREDTGITMKLLEAASKENIRLLDHLIFSGTDVFSYASSAKFGKYF